ncbi:hypothetical protein JD844_000305 [Phrynosoma platyrhinos]|uniref:Uncharacterized protein n=1 Tax=Phrynosoma platyrhinos TaxID=52577 RepID=A0ABQ7SQG5_PHRPL|nr:hypothetical protein JD844_000305 [Phrynosoma platyrhinos]
MAAKSQEQNVNFLDEIKRMHLELRKEIRDSREETSKEIRESREETKKELKFEAKLIRQDLDKINKDMEKITIKMEKLEFRMKLVENKVDDLVKQQHEDQEAILKLEQITELSSFSLPCSCDLDYDIYKDDLPYRVYEYQKIPPLISHVPVKTRRSHLGTGGFHSFCEQSCPCYEEKVVMDYLYNLCEQAQIESWFQHEKATLNKDFRCKLDHSHNLFIPVQAEELHSIKGELSQIKAQVDSLLESLDRMDQQRNHNAGSKDSKKKNPASGKASCPAGDPAQMKESTEIDGHAALQDVDSAEESTDTEEAVGSQTDIYAAKEKLQTGK